MNNIGSALKAVFDVLKQRGDVRSQKEFAAKLDTYSHALNEMYKGKRPVTVKILERLYNVYNGNINFLLSGGRGQMFRNGPNDESKEDQVQLTILQREVTHLSKELVSKDKIILLLETQLRDVQAKMRVI